MGKRRGGTRKACVLVAVMACVLAVVGLGLIATGRLCITSARRPADRYGQDCCSDGGGAAGIALSGAVDSPDVDFDGIPDDEDILAAALSYIGTRPHYKSAYYASGYPDDEFGVCTDVVAIACRDAGYDLQRTKGMSVSCPIAATCRGSRISSTMRARSSCAMRRTGWSAMDASSGITA